MTNLIVATFKKEADAIEASHKLAEMEAFGDVTIYERVIVKKNQNGETSVVQEDTTEGLRAVSGMEKQDCRVQGRSKKGCIRL